MENLSVGIVRFPCSNCDFDTLKYFQKFGHSPEFIWHKEREYRDFDLFVLPGGFAFGDRDYEQATGQYEINPGVMAARSPVMDIVRRANDLGKPILGICNGFQILVLAGLLPGKLEQNDSRKFFCNQIKSRVTGKSFFDSIDMLGGVFNTPVAHGFGKYVVNGQTYEKLRGNNQIFLKYEGFNPNGSLYNIAGVCNESGNVYGMMPHPERSTDGQYFMEALEKYVRNR